MRPYTIGARSSRSTITDDEAKPRISWGRSSQDIFVAIVRHPNNTHLKIYARFYSKYFKRFFELSNDYNNMYDQYIQKKQDKKYEVRCADVYYDQGFKRTMTFAITK